MRLAKWKGTLGGGSRRGLSRAAGLLPRTRGGVPLAAALLFCLGAVFLAAGCSGGKKPSGAPSKTAAITEEGLFDPMTPRELERWQPDVRLAAWWDNGQVCVVIRNRTNQDLAVRYANFGVLGNRKEYPVRMEDVRVLFPDTVLHSGEMATGRFQFYKLGDLTGAHLVFHHSKTQPSRCVIRATRAPGGEAEPPPPSGAEPTTRTLGGSLETPRSGGAKP